MTVQIITTTPTAIFTTPGSPVSFDVRYGVADNNFQLSGIGVTLFYDSTRLQYIANSFTNVFNSPAPNPTESETADVGNADGDATTDRSVNIAWFTLDSSFPGLDTNPMTFPIRLYTANFTATNTLGLTNVNFVPSSNSAGYTLAPVPPLPITIAAAPVIPTVSIAPTDANKNEGNAGTNNFTFTATRAGDTTLASTLSFAVSGAAVDGADFVGGVLTTGMVTFPAGSTTQLVTIPVQGDTAVEANEDFTVTLTSVTNATVTPPTATGTIVNDDSNVLPPLVPTPGTTNIPSGAGRLLLGNNLDNVIVGAASNDTIYGYAGNDVVDAAGGNDYVDGGIGNDLLFGGMGNDTVVGGAGFDMLSGVIRSGINPGLGEQDRLVGGADADLFLLGDGIGVYYSDNNPATLGLSDFAIISDFSVSLDRIQLTGLPANYSISTTTGGGVTGAGIFLTDGELIGILSGISPASLNLNSSSFAYV